MVDERALITIGYALLATILLLASIRFVVWLWNRFHPARLELAASPTDDDLKALEFSRQQDREEERPRCVCGELATHVTPKLVRKRTSWVRSFFAMAPRYKRVVPPTSYLFGLWELDIPIEDLGLCQTHAHVADAMMDKFIYQDVRAMQADTNEKIAIKAAGFEQEALLEQIKASLTDNQKKAARRGQSSGQVRLLTKTGTDGPTE